MRAIPLAPSDLVAPGDLIAHINKGLPPQHLSDLLHGSAHDGVYVNGAAHPGRNLSQNLLAMGACLSLLKEANALNDGRCLVDQAVNVTYFIPGHFHRRAALSVEKTYPLPADY
jgi:hypothetical protein